MKIEDLEKKLRENYNNVQKTEDQIILSLNEKRGVQASIITPGFKSYRFCYLSFPLDLGLKTFSENEDLVRNTKLLEEIYKQLKAQNPEAFLSQGKIYESSFYFSEKSSIEAITPAAINLSKIFSKKSKQSY